MRLLRLWLFGVIVAGCAGHVPSSPAPTPTAVESPDAPITRAVATITPDDMLRRVGYLASDELRGRDTPSPGLEMAAEYIANEFRSLGLEPKGDSGTFIQRWPYRSARLDLTNVTLRATGTQGANSLVYAQDFFVLPSTQGSVTAPLVFAGTAAPGRQPPGPEAAGKAVAFFVPGAQPDPAWNAAAGVAVQGSMSANAAAIVLILDPQFSQEMVATLASQLGEQGGAPKPIIGISYAAARVLFQNGLSDLDVLRTRDNRIVPVTGTTLTLTATQSTSNVRPPNVVAMVPGSDPALRDTYVVFSAHIDHVGVGAPDAKGDSIYNGADDDASGTATLIEVAEAFASLPVKPARSLIFLGVSGEEKGLLGSAYFAENPTVPAKQIVANINIDMVGRNAPDTIVAIGQEYTSLGTTVQEIAQAHPELGLVVAPDLWPEENLFLRSDHFNFARIGVPAIFFTSGLHADYHRPSDEVELIDTDKLARVARLVFHLGHAIASGSSVPTWTDAGRAVMRSPGDH
jgi:Zn-dependent M28 family amino/carboxypeptidase